MSKPRRVTHYHAHGRGLAFECYRAPLRAWLERAEASPQTTRTGDAPRRTTDLNRVTCPACWQSIRRMAGNVLSPPPREDA